MRITATMGDTSLSESQPALVVTSLTPPKGQCAEEGCGRYAATGEYCVKHLREQREDATDA